MKKTSLVALIAMALMLVSVFAPAVFSGPTQPPVDTTTLYVGTIAWGPYDADAVQAYDTASGEILFNVMETLIELGEPVTYSGTEYDVQEQYWTFSPELATNVPIRQEIIMTTMDTGINPTDPVCYWFEPIPPDGKWYHIEGWVDNNPDGVLGYCDVLYIGEYFAPMLPIQEAITVRTWHVLEFVPGVLLTVHHWYYDFILGPAVDFYDHTGAVVGTFGMDDVIYSLQRGMVQDMWGGPYWMFYKPLFDQMNSDWWGEDTSGDPNMAWMLALLIKDAFEDMGQGVFRLNVGIAFPDVAFKQIVAQSWGSIYDKDWVINKGMWDGNLFTDNDQDGWLDWFESYAEGGWRHIDWSEDPMDTTVADNYMGTGPYHVSVMDDATGLVILERNPGYWRGWPAQNRKGYLDAVQIEYIAAWATRREAFKACQLDVCAVPRTYIPELLDPNDPARMKVGWGDPFVAHPEVITIKNISPTLSIDAIHYVFNVSNTDGDLYTGQFPDGAPGDFFYNLNVRKAFAYGFNRSKYLSEVWLGEAICRETVNPFGMAPDYYCYAPDPPWTYDKNLDTMKSLLEAAMFTQGGETKSVWEWGGFHLKMYYNAGNEPRRLACEFIQNSFTELNNQYGKNFQITLVGMSWSGILAKLRASTAPTYTIGWLADFSDPDNFVRPYMHSYGDFSYFQKYWVSNGWATPGPRTGLDKDVLIDLGVKTPDGPDREEIYKDIDDIYILDCPSIPMTQALGRRFCKYWVKGWYYNAIYPSQQYYKLYKEDTCWADITGPTAGGGLPDGVNNMRDIGLIAARFGAKAPNPAGTPMYDPKWTPGVYGSFGCDVYGDRKVDMRDIGLAASHFGDTAEP